MLKSQDFNKCTFTNLVQVNYFVAESSGDLEFVVEKITNMYLNRSFQKNFSFNLEKELEVEIEKFRKKELEPVLILKYPENSLFPIKQKQIPEYLNFLNQKFKIPIFVITTSPFILGGMMKLTESRKRILDIAKKNFKPSQKVYFLNQKKVVSKNGNSDLNQNGICKGSDGYWGYKAGKLAMKILGLGLDDFLSNIEPEYSSDSPILVFCEGRGKNNDAKLYNKIFKPFFIPILFVSSKSNSETLWSFELLTQVKNGLSGDFKILMLRDRDHDFPNIEDIFRLQKKHPSRRILFKRAIECYLYNSETAKILCQKYNLELPKNLLLELDKLNLEIQKEVEKKFLGDSYKERLQKSFKKIHNYLQQKHPKISEIPSFKDLKFLIAEEISPQTQIYQELVRVLFG